MAEGDAEDRTQTASARRLQQSREEGDVPLSRELPVLAGLAAATFILALWVPTGGRNFAAALTRMLAHPEESSVRGAVMTMGYALIPLLAAVAVAGSGAVLGQTQFLLHLGALKPSFGRLDPRRGLKRIGGRDSVIETTRAVVKLGLLAWAAWHALAGLLPQLGESLLWRPSMLLDQLVRSLLHLLFLVLGAYAVVAAFDLLLVRIRYARRMRMSQEDQRQETKETEGDPQIKARIRRLRMTRARRRMMAAVPTATVVVTNPTHYAVALSYDRGKGGAPQVVAKGVDEMAARIRAVAESSRVPMVANAPLARALYRVELDREVPAEHFQTVAEVIAYVWRLRGQARSP